MFCGKCGNKIDDGAKFCPSCGASVEKQENMTVSSASDRERGKKKSKKGILIFILIILVVLFIGLAICWIQKKPIDEGGNIDTQQTESTEGEVQDTEEQDEQPKIKSEEKYYGAKLDHKYEYDIKGNIIYSEYEDYGYSTYEYTYSDEKIVSMIYKNYNEDGAFESEGYVTCEYSDAGVIQKASYYDKSGNLIGEQNYNDDGQILSAWQEGIDWVYKYDSRGNLLEEICNNEYYKSCTYYKYDENNNLVEEYCPTYDITFGTLEWETTYYYAKNGLLTESKHANEYGEDITTYNRYSDEIEVREYDEDGNFEGYTEYEYQYDAHGNKIGRHTIYYDSSYNQEDENWYYWEYTYDEAGNILDQYEYEQDGELTYSYHYTYY